MDRQGVRRDDVALLREGTQIDRSNLAQEQVDHSTASLADEMIVLAGLGIESGSLFAQEEGADLTPIDETVKVAINGGETDPRQFFVNPLVDLMGERVSVIALESFEHLLQLACRTFAGGPPHRLTSKSWIPSGSDRTVSGRGYQIDGFLSSNSPGDPVSSGGVEREELGSTLAHLPGVIDESKRFAKIWDDVTRPSERSLDQRCPPRGQRRLRPARGARFRHHDAVLQRVAHAAHRQYGVRAVERVVEPPATRGRWRPPAMQQTPDGVAQISGDWIDQRAWIGTDKRDSVLTYRVPVNHPGAVVLLSEELITATLDTGMGIVIGIETPKCTAWNVRDLELY